MRSLDNLEAMSVLGHELRRPLTVIRGAASLLREAEGKLPPERSDHMLRLIESSGTAMAQLVEDVLLVCHLDAGDLRADLQPVAAGRVAQAALEAVRDRAAGCRLALELPEPEPVARADPDLAVTVLRALLDNAIQASPPGETVELAIASAPGEVRMEVRDRGPGLPPAQTEAAFERFRRLSQAGPGAGLGLYLARGLARHMGGDVGVEPRPDGGSIFWFRLVRDV